MRNPVQYHQENLKHLEGIAKASGVPDILRDSDRQRYGPFVWQGIMGTTDENGLVLPIAALVLPIQVEYNKEVIGGYSDSKMARTWRVATVFDENWMRGEKIMPHFGPTRFPGGSYFIDEWFKNLAQADEGNQYTYDREQPGSRYGVKTVLQVDVNKNISPRELIDKHIANYLKVRRSLLDKPEEEKETDARVKIGLGFLEELVK